ncbi:MAG: hypothetical protein IT473_07875 [Lysobacter sp.]|nr:hypothetical protein [Lysobacter sp.]
MPSKVPAGPFAIRKTAEGAEFPYYILPFDKDGVCEAPETRRHLLEQVADRSDIYVFCHGWNNDWKAATGRYAEFIDQLVAQRKIHGPPTPPDYRPLLVGLFWPSQALEWFESETGPAMAGAVGDTAAETALSEEIAEALPEERRARFRELIGADALDEAHSRELADLLASAASPGDDEGVPRGALSAEDLLAAASALQTPPPPDFDEIGSAIPGGTVPGNAANSGETPAAAGIGDALNWLDPRHLIKPFTVWTMKDRAGVVGGRGVRALLDALLRDSRARIHLLGHSFGCKVVMTATASLPEPMPRKIHSAVLLQPAVSQYAFAPKVPETGLPGGFYKTLARIERPVVATFSAHDLALNKAFHLALRRANDLGEQPLAAGESPSPYAALGGFGPRASNETIVFIHNPGEAYDFGSGGRIVGIRGTRTIGGHGDINNASTWWLASNAALGT